MALTKAFKRSFGISPAAYRRDSRSVARRAPTAS
jgi:AraC-like DNA-binding protein